MKDERERKREGGREKWEREMGEGELLPSFYFSRNGGKGREEGQERCPHSIYLHVIYRD